MRKNILLGALAAVALSTAATGAQAVEFITNGDFEAGGGSLSGWTVGGSVAALTAAQYAPCCGVVGSEPNYSSNHFASFGSGNVTSLNLTSQSFGTVLGRSYTVSFDHGAFGAGSQALEVLVGGVSQGFFNAPAVNNSDLTWISESFSFLGTGLNTSVEFRVNTVSDNVDALLDNVSVSAVSEPGTWALMITGFGLAGAALRRRRQAPVAA